MQDRKQISLACIVSSSLSHYLYFFIFMSDVLKPAPHSKGREPLVVNTPWITLNIHYDLNVTHHECLLDYQSHILQLWWKLSIEEKLECISSKREDTQNQGLWLVSEFQSSFQWNIPFQFDQLDFCHWPWYQLRPYLQKNGHWSQPEAVALDARILYQSVWVWVSALWRSFLLAHVSLER